MGSGSVLNRIPTGQHGPTDESGAAVFPQVASGVKGPYPTNDWWSSLIFPRTAKTPFGKPLFAWPLSLQAGATGWGVGGQAATAGTTEFHAGHSNDLVAGLDGLTAPKAQVVSWGDWTVTARLADDTRTLDATFGSGIPSVYLQSTGGKATVICASAPTVWAGSGTNSVGITINGRPYGLFAPSGASWALSGTTFSSTLNGKSYWSLSRLPSADVAVLARFARSAFSVPVDSRVSWSYDSAAGTMRTVYRLTTAAREGSDSSCLMALFRHQWSYSKNVNTTWTYPSPQGTMEVVDGTSFTTEDELPAIFPSLPPISAEDSSKLASDLIAAASQQLLSPAGTETYFTGKGLWRCASLVPIADQLGRTALRDSLLGLLKAKLTDWFTATSNGTEKTSTTFAYDSAWGSLIGYPAGYGSDGELNDHHFHWGYFLMAAATVARYDHDWAKAYGPVVKLLVRDANNPYRNDAMFPFMRHFDPYHGHSWASGHANFTSGNNQESSSESMFFNSAVALWGMATGDDTLRNAGLWMASVEMRAVEQYWWNADAAVFPQGFSYQAVGMVWGDGGAHATWFSAEPEAIHGINVLPFSPSTSFLWTRSSRRATAILSEMHREKSGGAFAMWRDVLFAYQAIANADSAQTDFDAWDGSNGEGWIPKAWYRQWISDLRHYGAWDTTVHADQPAAMAFVKNGTRRYFGWNPGPAATTVHFSDGQELAVPAGQIAFGFGEPTTGISCHPAGSPVFAHLHGNELLISLTEAGEVRLTAFDLEGRILEIRNLGRQSAGTHAFKLSESRGMRILRIQAGTERQTLQAAFF